MVKDVLETPRPTESGIGYMEASRRTRYSLRRVSLVLLSIAVGLAPLPLNILGPRAFNTSHRLSELSGYEDPKLFLIRSLFGATVLGLSVVAFVSVRRHRITQANLRLWLSALAFGLALIASGIFGANRGLSPYTFVLPLSFTALLVLDESDMTWFIRLGRRICLVYIYGSLLAAVLLPEVALQAPYRQGWVFTFRLHGVATLANHLAPLAVLFMLLDLIERRALTLLRVLHWLAALTVFVLTQSKTVWVAVTVATLTVTWLRFGPRRRILSGLVLTPALACTVVLLVTQVPVEVVAGNPYVWQVTTLTGRTAVWSFTVDAWLQNPIFGYGSGLWSGEMRLNFYRMYRWTPGQAHNQFFQTLGQAGLVGIAGLGLYVLALVRHCVSYSGYRYGVVSIAIVIMLLRGLTESALQGVLFGESFIFHFFVFGTLILLNKRKAHG